MLEETERIGQSSDVAPRSSSTNNFQKAIKYRTGKSTRIWPCKA